jgi:3D (Asp-Asp-Asp) domain-containing protein
MLISRSLRRKLLATLIGSAAFLLVYEATVVDSRSVSSAQVPEIRTGARMSFVATAYCKGQTTASGVRVKRGMAAADPRMLPQGSIVQLDGLPDGHEGLYTVLDTGPAVKGRHVDLYMWSCHEALAFGRRPVTLTVLRLGWDPATSASAAGGETGTAE